MASQAAIAHPPAPTASIKSLDGTRQRLQQLSVSLANLKYSLESGGALPQWEQLQSLSDMCTQQLRQLSTHLTDSTNASFLQTAHAYPLPSFVDNSHEGMMQSMLRAKPEPDVERWIDDGLAKGRAVAEAKDKTGLDVDGYKSLWASAAEMAVGVSSELPFGMDYTQEERERLVEGEVVITGLKRELDDGLEEEDEEGSDDDDNETKATKRLAQQREKEAEQLRERQKNAPPVKPPALLEDMMRFMNSGVVTPELAGNV